MIDWHVSKTENDLIVKIAQRVERDLQSPDNRMTIIMDLTACHANGCQLKLAELLDAAPFDFSHDYYGIRLHINRTTGKLEGCFLPRYAA